MDIKSRLPGALKAVARPVVWRVSDTVATMRGDLSPPRRLMSQVPGDFRQVGQEFLRYFTTFGGLLPHHRAIDIGCGPGRMAIPLTGFMSSDGSYEGIDSWSEGVDWCSRHITPRFRNFRFGSLDADRNGGDSFPYEDGDFDFAILCAISKLDEKTFRTYVVEAGRVLRSGGVYFGTCFLSYDPADRPDSDFRSKGQEPPFVLSVRKMEGALNAAGLSVQSVHRGAWAGHPEPLSYQDVVVAIRS